MDWTTFNAGIDFADPLTSVGTIALALAGVYVVTRGVGIVLGMIRG